MKIALLHYSAWPQIGGVENFIRDQAVLLTHEGHEVTVLTGIGESPKENYTFTLIPEMAPDFPLNADVRSVLNRGQSDQKFTQYRSLLQEVLRPHLAKVDVTIVHNIFTMHFNLALTQALHDLSAEFKLIAWTHDMVATNSDYSLPNPTKPPWNLVRIAPPTVSYVVASEVMEKELKTHLKPTLPTRVIPDAIDMSRHFHLTDEMRASLDALKLNLRDFIFFFPAARLTPRKNIEFAIEIVKKIKESGRQPLLLITGMADPQNASGTQYAQYLRTCIPSSLKRCVVFVNDHFPAQDSHMKDFYCISDCLLFPVKHEGFGLPILEAALYRIPIWCNEVPAFTALQGEGMFMFNDIAQLPEALQWLETQPVFRLQRLVRQSFDVSSIYRKYYAPLLEEMKKR